MSEAGGSERTAKSSGGGGFGFKKKGAGGRANVRKRTAEEDEGDGAADNVSALIQPEKKRKELALGGSTARDDKDKLQVFTFQGDRSIQQRGDGGATAELQWETEKHLDGRAMREQVLKNAAERAGGFEDDKTYKGMNSYIDYRAGFRKEHSIASEKGTGAHGPLRASTNVRLTFIMDYKPDICKDYKETGYCGYGDACKFLHDRGDYKHGWQLDKDWERKQQERKEAQAKLEKLERGLDEDGQPMEEEDEDEEDNLGIPVACPICSRTWDQIKDPVVTRCKHYFCEHCALRHNASDKTCFVCQRPVGGTFNAAKEITRRVKEMKETGGTWGHKKTVKRSAEYADVGSQGWLLG